MRAAFYTLGCKLNQCESESVASSFSGAGWTIVPPLTDADLYIVNTCTVTSKSEQKARRIIRKLAREHPGSAIIVSGCYAQLEREEISGLAESVLVIPHSAKSLLHDIPAGLESAGISAPGPLFASWIG